MVTVRVSRLRFDYDAPQIERDGEPLRSVADRPEPAGFGPMPPVWKSRAPYFGTVDLAAVANGGPRLPADHDYRYWQVAPPALRLPGYLAADTIVELGRLVAGGGALAFALPDHEPYCQFSQKRDPGFASKRDPSVVHDRG